MSNICLKVVGTRRLPSASEEVTVHGVCLLHCIAHQRNTTFYWNPLL